MGVAVHLRYPVLIGRSDPQCPEHALSLRLTTLVPRRLMRREGAREQCLSTEQRMPKSPLEFLSN